MTVDPFSRNPGSQRNLYITRPSSVSFLRTLPFISVFSIGVQPANKREVVSLSLSLAGRESSADLSREQVPNNDLHEACRNIQQAGLLGASSGEDRDRAAYFKVGGGGLTLRGMMGGCDSLTLNFCLFSD